MSDRYKTPKLAFKKVDGEPLHLQFGNAYYPGCFTMTGINYDNPDYLPMLEWCKENNIYTHPLHMDRLIFENEQQIAWFLLRWS